MGELGFLKILHSVAATGHLSLRLPTMAPQSLLLFPSNRAPRGGGDAVDAFMPFFLLSPFPPGVPCVSFLPKHQCIKF